MQPNSDERLADLIGELRAFVAERDWGRFHDPKNLSMLVASEAGELAAVLRWVDNGDADEVAKRDPTLLTLSDEIADVAIGLLLLCDRLGVDFIEVSRRKVARNRLRYPVEQSRGVAERPSVAASKAP
ncbi:MAG: MazG-like family protein [Polyangiales bacterium]